MSTFISYNNQTILWNTIQKVPLLQQKIQKEYQANWFRQIIEDIYKTNIEILMFRIKRIK